MTEIKNRENVFFNYIEKLLKNNVLSHAYLIEVNNYSDDYNKVLNFVKLILCNKKKKSIDGLNCNDCNICGLIDNNSYPDLYVIEPDGNFIKKEQIINLESEFSNYSLLGNKRIYIIKEADKMNDYSANTILKFLEEPSEDIIAILLTTNRYKIIDTILSRCQLISVKTTSCIDNIDKFELLLKNMINIDDLFINYDEIVDELFTGEDNKIDKSVVKNYFMDLSVLFIDYYNDNCDDITGNISEILNKISKEKIFNYICVIENELSKLDFNVNNKLWLDMLFSKFIDNGGTL